MAMQTLRTDFLDTLRRLRKDIKRIIKSKLGGCCLYQNTPTVDPHTSGSCEKGKGPDQSLYTWPRLAQRDDGARTVLCARHGSQLWLCATGEKTRPANKMLPQQPGVAEEDIKKLDVSLEVEMQMAALHTIPDANGQTSRANIPKSKMDIKIAP
ncbi:hypothetical protein K505DRAFT_332388 [Melanomma pulvis-pyrius CBS 109.77]|uniref:Uncharacterized protein n=1 Tax=Melanomma pulvis-pyrius CBS 109.77 TaxID=1314802 RepID=A0A6A6XVB8_9PLEO|nr:hypothetical protein K505DRAFT_332388 [Melanomma pulvis-pyrius CBS 109.77]